MGAKKLIKLLEAVIKLKEDAELFPVKYTRLYLGAGKKAELTKEQQNSLTEAGALWDPATDEFYIGL